MCENREEKLCALPKQCHVIGNPQTGALRTEAKEESVHLPPSHIGAMVQAFKSAEVAVTQVNKSRAQGLICMQLSLGPPKREGYSPPSKLPVFLGKMSHLQEIIGKSPKVLLIGSLRSVWKQGHRVHCEKYRCHSLSISL